MGAKPNQQIDETLRIFHTIQASDNAIAIALQAILSSYSHLYPSIHTLLTLCPFALHRVLTHRLPTIPSISPYVTLQEGKHWHHKSFIILKNDIELGLNLNLSELPLKPYQIGRRMDSNLIFFYMKDFVFGQIDPKVTPL